MISTSEFKWVGKPVKIREDVFSIRGRGIYLDDIELPNAAYMAYLRSSVGHGTIRKIDVSRAKALKGVIAVYTGEEISRFLNPYPEISPTSKIIDYPLAVGKVRYFGEPVAVIVAENKYAAEDAANLIDVEYEPLPAVIDPKKALEKDEPLVHEENGSNIVWSGVWNLGDVEEAFKQADYVIEEDLYFERYLSAPLETTVVIGNYDEIEDTYTIYSNNVMPMFTIPLIAPALSTSPDKIRMITPPNVGGSFGSKIINYTHMTLAALLSKLVRRPVKYVETRTEHIMSGTHNNERVFNVKVAVKRDGTILGIKIKAIDNCGAYPRYEPAGAVIWSQVTHGMYKVRNIYVEFYQVMTNKGPTGPIRGYSRIQHNFMWERVIDIIARKLGLDPAEVRLKNYIRPEEMPYEGPSGVIYDGGDYITGMKLLLKELEYEKWRELQKEYRKQSKYIGIGIAGVIDSAANNFGQVKIINKDFPMSGNAEAAMVMIDPSGKIIARVGATDQGQSHATTFAQVLAEEFNVDINDVIVTRGFDSWSNPWAYTSGAYASRNAVMSVGALVGAARELKRKILKIASSILNEDVENLEIRDKKVISKISGKSILFQEIATMAWFDMMKLPEDVEPGLVSYYIYRPNFRNNLPDERKRINNTLTYSYQLHGVVAEVDPETGFIKILKHVIVSDPGIPINPVVVEGQEIGAAAHGIEASLLAKLEYNEDGILLNSNLLDYVLLTSQTMPDSRIVHAITPSTSSVIGARGVGEGGGGPIAAIANAVEDALSPFGITIRKSHLSPMYIFELMKGGKK